MRLSILLFASAVAASPFRIDGEQEPSDLLGRGCALYCGYSSQLCCSTGQVCYTDFNNQAQCSTATSVPGSTGVVVSAAATPTCRTDQGQTQCGSGCCDAGLICQGNGACAGGQTTVAIVSQTTVTVSTVTSTAITTTSVATNGLDGGSIAGIIIGVIFGIIVLIWMCGPITNSPNPFGRASGSVSRRSRR